MQTQQQFPVQQLAHAQTQNVHTLLTQQQTAVNQNRHAQSASGSTGPNPKYPRTSAMILGILEMIFGLISIILQVVLSAWHRKHIGLPFYGFWAAIPLFVCGVLSVISSKTPNTGLLIFLMIKSIITAILMLPYLICSSISLGLAANRLEYLDVFFINLGQNRAVIAMDSFGILVSIVGTILVIWTSANTCCGVCCNSSPESNVYVSPGQQLIITNGNGIPINTVTPLQTQGGVVFMTGGGVQQQQIQYVMPAGAVAPATAPAPVIAAQGVVSPPHYTVNAPQTMGTSNPVYANNEQAPGVQAPGAQAPAYETLSSVTNQNGSETYTNLTEEKRPIV